MPSGVYKRTEEHISNIKKSLTGRKRTPEQCEAMSKARAGRSWTQAQKDGHARWKASGAKLPKKVLSQKTKDLLSAGRMQRSYILAEKYGVSVDEYAAQRAAGNRWCYIHKGFSPKEYFPVKGQSYCETCRTEANRRSDLKKHYGVTVEWYDEKLRKQGGGCALCGSKVASKGDRNMCIDHCHDSGAIRGILCAPCNFGVMCIDRMPGWGLKAESYVANRGIPE